MYFPSTEGKTRVQYLPWIKRVLDEQCGQDAPFTLEEFIRCGENLIPDLLDPHTPFGRNITTTVLPTQVEVNPQWLRMWQPRDRVKRSFLEVDLGLECATYIPMVVGLVLALHGNDEQGTTPPPRRIPRLPDPYLCDGVEDYTLDEVMLSCRCQVQFIEMFLFVI